MKKDAHKINMLHIEENVPANQEATNSEKQENGPEEPD